MANAYQSNLLGDIYRRQSQRRALTGLPSSYQEQRGLFDSVLDYDARKAADAGLLQQRTNEFNRSISLHEQAQKDAANAAKVSGVTQMAMLPLAYQSAKSMGWVGGKAAVPAAVPAASPGLMGTTPAAAGTAQGAVAPAAAGTAQGMATAAYPGLAGGTAVPGQVGPMSMNVAAEGAGTGLFSTLAPYAGPAAAGLLGGQLLGPTLDKVLPGGGKTGKFVGGAAGGAMAGAAIGMMGGPLSPVTAPVGALIGGIIGGISSLF